MVPAPVQPTTDMKGAVPSDRNLRSETGDECEGDGRCSLVLQ